MEIPISVWKCILQNNRTLLEEVGDIQPDILEIQDINAFREIWEQRLQDAIYSKDKILKKKSENVLQFVSENPHDLSLLIWVKHKIPILYSVITERHLVIN